MININFSLNIIEEIDFEYLANIFKHQNHNQSKYVHIVFIILI